MTRRNKMSKKKDVPQSEEALQPETVPAENEQAEETNIADDIAELRTQLEEAVKQREEYLNLAQRVQADFENFRRRNSGVRAEAYEDGARAFIKTILPVIDNLERALAAESNDQALKEGVTLVYRQLSDVLEKRGVTVIDRTGEKFDPALENAVMQGTADEGEPGTVCAVLQKGYRMGDFVLRHAMVKVVAE
jgi:Molecular chaperone GrpE (heat shock protein)